MIRRPARVIAAACAVWAVVACLDVASPVKGISAISPVLLPTPSVVLHDSMRDTGGRVMPLRVQVYAPNGDTLPSQQFKVTFVEIDTSNALILDDTGGVVGKKISPTVQVVAKVTFLAGGGNIQTLSVSLPVVPQPTSATRDSDFTFTPPFSATDTLSSLLISKPLSVTVYSGTSAPVQSYPVLFDRVVYPHRFQYKGHLVELTNGVGRDTTVAVTGSGGAAQIYLRFRPSAATADQLAQLDVTPDTVIVHVKVRYGESGLVPVAPSDSFVILVRPGAKIQ